MPEFARWPRAACLWLIRRLRLKKEEPRATIREIVKIVIAAAAIGTLAVQTRLSGIQGDQLRVQARQLEQATRTANIGLATRLSAQRIAIENTTIKLGLLDRSLGEMLQLTTGSFIKGRELDPDALARAGELIARVRADRDVLEAVTHDLPFEAFKAVRKYYISAAVWSEQFARDLAALPKDSRVQAMLNPDAAVLEMLRKDGLPPPKPFPRFADALGEARREAFKDQFEAIKALIDAGTEVEKRWTEVERAINSPDH